MGRTTTLLPLLIAVACGHIAPVAHAEEPGLVSERPISGRFVETDRGYMVPYTVTLPDVTPGQQQPITFQMMPIPGGTFLLGSPPDEPGRREDEGPQVEVRVDPFWMAVHEVTWDEYAEFMRLDRVFLELEQREMAKVDPNLRIDAITAPSIVYDPNYHIEFTTSVRCPAVSMTQYAARQYTKWLSKVTAQDFRLPTEAEWEYACRAGSTTSWSTAGDADELRASAVFELSRDVEQGPREVGSLQANAWGLCDMHGNVSEWVLDQYDAKHYAAVADRSPITTAGAVRAPDQRYLHVHRGGNWTSQAVDCRSAARSHSSRDLWNDDPSIPMSPSWMASSEANAIGFRLLRPLKAMSIEEGRRAWDADSAELLSDLDELRELGTCRIGLIDGTYINAARRVSARNLQHRRSEDELRERIFHR
ncbi:MAG: formylglycine-generating enzyme family protein [Planctomycetaceae bacterium]